MLTRIFDWYGIEFRELDKVVAKDFLDVKSLAQSHLKVEKNGNLIQLERPISSLTPDTPLIDNYCDISDFKFTQFMSTVRDDNKVLFLKLEAQGSIS